MVGERGGVAQGRVVDLFSVIFVQVRGCPGGGGAGSEQRKASPLTRPGAQEGRNIREASPLDQSPLILQGRGVQPAPCRRLELGQEVGEIGGPLDCHCG